MIDHNIKQTQTQKIMEQPTTNANNNNCKNPIEVYNYRNCNPKNKYITKKDVQHILKKHGINNEINDITLYQQAFVAESYVKPKKQILETLPPFTNEETKQKDMLIVQCIPLQNSSYDRFEFLGDRILDMVIADYIFHRFQEYDEGFYTDMKIKLVRTRNLYIIAQKLKLSDFLMISKIAERDRQKDKILEDVFEAFLGAIYQDFGCGGLAYDICKKFIINVLEKYINISKVTHCKDNYKKQLSEYYHAMFKAEDGKGIDPEWETISTYGPTSNRVFKAGVKNIDGHIIATGTGYTLKDAHQEAAKNALKYYGVSVYEDTEDPIKDIYSDSDSDSEEAVSATGSTTSTVSS